MNVLNRRLGLEQEFFLIQEEGIGTEVERRSRLAFSPATLPGQDKMVTK
ncbi:MAG: hypothetical protein J7524_02350 [Roseofilum sp. Belize BBD 4]|nr:hypothetical protein [Roseofilum sp. Belize BBD 4]MBP0031993.1 hypothetical protein [Roseofilum sp. Belize BBD 4]